MSLDGRRRRSRLDGRRRRSRVDEWRHRQSHQVFVSSVHYSVVHLVVKYYSRFLQD